MEETIPRMLRATVERYPDQIAQLYRDAQGRFQSTSYRDLYGQVRTVACGLYSLGVRREDRVAVIADNRREWLLYDLALLSIGAIDVPRGCDSLPQEILAILRLTSCKTALAEDERQLRSLLALAGQLPALERIVVMDPDYRPKELPEKTARIRIVATPEVLAEGTRYGERDPECFEREVNRSKAGDVATIIFTSGTTGQPKGVMLSHGSFLHQVRSVPGIVRPRPGDICLSVLPIWHSFERIMEYLAIGVAATTAYSKAVARIMLADFADLRPHWMASVPRIWEGIRAGVYRRVRSGGPVSRGLFTFFVGVGKAHFYLRSLLLGRLPRFGKRIRALDAGLAVLPFLLLTPLRLLAHRLAFAPIERRLGGRFVAGFSAGATLPPSVADFFSAAGVLLLQAYGLTESGPLLTLQRQAGSVRGTVGRPIPGTEIRIVDETMAGLPAGRKGLILARGPQIMLGYYHDPERTARVLSPQGWLNTGDLGTLTRTGELIVTGRAKDTIVLGTGENVEPGPIEGALRTSSYIQQAVVLGQDQKFLAALIVPDAEELSGYASRSGIAQTELEALIREPEINAVIEREIRRLISVRNGFKAFEQVSRFRLLARPFQVGRELSSKQEVKRQAVSQLYRREIEDLFRKG